MVGHDLNDLGIPCSLMVRRTKCLVLSCVRLLYLSQNLSVFTKKNYHVLETFDIIKL